MLRSTLVGRILLPLVALAPLALAAAHAADISALNANIHVRGNFYNSLLQFEREQSDHKRRGHVAFVGGSITEMEGFRPLVCAWLTKRFPNTIFKFTNAGVASTCSSTGAFRLSNDVLKRGQVDLVFIEFAVNDDQDAAHTREECIRGMEGMFRQIYRLYPRADVVVIYFLNKEMIATLANGKLPVSIAAHEDVAKHYNISSINLAKEVSEQIASGRITWEQYGGVHPAPFGNELCAQMITAMLGRAWEVELPKNSQPRGHLLPDPLDPLNYSGGHFVELEKAQITAGWTLGVPNWQQIPGPVRARFATRPLLCAEQPGAELKLTFAGMAVGAYVLAGPDSGVLEAVVDNRPPVEVNLLHAYSANLQYPRTVMFATDLKLGQHTLVLRVAPKTASTGHAARILNFVAN